MAAGMVGDHHHLCADLPAAAAAFRHRPAVLRYPGCPQPADLVPDPAHGDVGLLSQGRGAATGPSDPDLCGFAAVPGDGVHRHDRDVRVPGDRLLAAPDVLRKVRHVLDPLLQLPALELRDRLAGGALRAVDLAKAYLAQIEKREPEVQAWAWLDSDHVLAQAARLDAYRASGRPVGS